MQFQSSNLEEFRFTSDDGDGGGEGDLEEPYKPTGS